jgi:hypothetical protein
MAVRNLLERLSNERPHDRWSAVNAAENAIILAFGKGRNRETPSAKRQAPSEFGSAVRSKGADKAT